MARVQSYEGLDARVQIKHYCEGCDMIFDGYECPDCGRPVAISDGFTIPRSRSTREQMMRPAARDVGE